MPELYYNVKQEQPDTEMSMDIGDSSFMGDSFGSYGEEYGAEGDEEEPSNNGDDDTNYDDLVEESLLEVRRINLR